MKCKIGMQMFLAAITKEKKCFQLCHHHHGVLLAWISLILSGHPSLSASPVDSTQCLHRVNECNFFFVSQHGFVHRT